MITVEVSTKLRFILPIIYLMFFLIVYFLDVSKSDLLHCTPSIGLVCFTGIGFFAIVLNLPIFIIFTLMGLSETNMSQLEQYVFVTSVGLVFYYFFGLLVEKLLVTKKKANKSGDSNYLAN